MGANTKPLLVIGRTGISSIMWSGFQLFNKVLRKREMADVAQNASYIGGCPGRVNCERASSIVDSNGSLKRL